MRFPSNSSIFTFSNIFEFGLTHIKIEYSNIDHEDKLE